LTETKHLATDVLVIGGGAAGCSAALSASRHGAKTLVVVKGKMGRSGATPLASALGLPIAVPGPYGLLRTLKGAYSWLADRMPLPLPRKYRDALGGIGAFHYWLVEQEYFLDYGLWMSKVFYPRLESTGLYGRRDLEGNLVTPLGEDLDFHLHSNGMTGYQFGESRRKEVRAHGIPVMEEASACALLRDAAGGVCGAMVFEYLTGQLYSITAKKTILATGHTNWLARRATGTREMAGNGLAMAARAGAECINLEMQWYHASDMAYPDSWMRLHAYPNPLSGSAHRGVMSDRSGEEYMTIEHFKSDMPYVIQMKKLYQRVQLGKAEWDRGSFASYRRVEPEALRNYQYHDEFYRKLGLNMATDQLECGATFHMSGGGVRANTKTMETRVPGLYIAGGVGGHMLGALCLASFDGDVAGAHAARTARSVQSPRLDLTQVATIERRLSGLLDTAQQHNSSDALSPIAIKHRIRSAVSDGLMFVKSETKLRRLQHELDEIEASLIPKVRLRTGARAYNTDLIEALDLHDMIDAARLIARAALERRESRGPHFREDYPFTDNENWLKQIVVSMSGKDIATRTETVRQKYVKPPAGKFDYLSHPYV
jgi:succinate dehydrogenase/fumarate reductase flavoprotein subunit